MIALLAAQAPEEGGGTEINLGVILLVVLVVIAAVVYHRRRRGR